MQQSPAGNELHLTHLDLLGGHHDCLLSTQRPGVASAPNQSSIIDSQTRSLDSHHHLRHWLPLSDLIAFSFQEPREIFMVPVRMLSIGSLSLLQTFTAFLQFIGEHYSAAGQDQLVFFETNDRMSTKKWKAVSSALDRNQPTTQFSNRTPKLSPNYDGENPLTDRSSGVVLTNPRYRTIA
jgi:hypothetical protein